MLIYAYYIWLSELHFNVMLGVFEHSEQLPHSSRCITIATHPINPKAHHGLQLSAPLSSILPRVVLVERMVISISPFHRLALKSSHSFHSSPRPKYISSTPSPVPIKPKRWQISVIKQLYCNMLSWKTCLEFKNHYDARDFISWRGWGFSCTEIHSPNRTITPRFTTNMRNTNIIFDGRIHCLRGEGLGYATCYVQIL